MLSQQDQSQIADFLSKFLNIRIWPSSGECQLIDTVLILGSILLHEVVNTASFKCDPYLGKVLDLRLFSALI